MIPDGPTTTPEALLRAPPFPGTTVRLSDGTRSTRQPEAAEVDRVFAAIRAARVGGAFWAPPAHAEAGTLVVRARSASDAAALRATLGEDGRILWVLPAGEVDPRSPFRGEVDPRSLLRGEVDPRSLLRGDIDPWSLLRGDVRLLAHGDDEWVAIAHLAGCPVRLLSPGLYGDPDAGEDETRRRVAERLFGPRYRDPFTGEDAGEDFGVDAIVARLGHWRRTFEANRGIVAACGIAWWKRREIARFLWAPGQRLRVFRSERRAIDHAARAGGAIAVWPSRMSTAMPAMAEAKGVPLVRIEDGFVRSAGLGSDLVPPSSITVDALGIHYDPSRASDLEVLLATADFPPDLLARAERLRATILAAGISKYGGDRAHVFPARMPGRRLVLVPGQVEDDMSVRLGGGGLTSNLELLRRARALEPGAEIWFRPHPDVDAGHRKGSVRDADALAVADRVVRGGGMAEMLALVDGVHVLTSLTGFEALLRDRDVTCHGMPFYAGWGLTRDLMPVPGRRGRALTLDRLLAAVLILYPRYLDPVTGLPCEPETLVARVAAGDARNRLGWVTRLRQWQGRLARLGR